ncbi:MAG: hypothetical protein ACKOB9_07545 [Solirubrobacterales bacterium]
MADEADLRPLGFEGDLLSRDPYRLLLGDSDLRSLAGERKQERGSKGNGDERERLPPRPGQRSGANPMAKDRALARFDRH